MKDEKEETRTAIQIAVDEEIRRIRENLLLAPSQDFRLAQAGSEIVDAVMRVLYPE